MERTASVRMFLSILFALCSALAMGCVLGRCFFNYTNFSKFSLQPFLLNVSLFFAAWSGTAIDSMKKAGSVPHIRHNGTEIHKDDKNPETWMSSCITLAALVGSFLSGVIIKFIGARKTLIGIGVPIVAGWAVIW